MLCQTPLYVALRACGVQDPGPLQLCCLANARLPVSRSPCAVWQPWLQLIGTASCSEIGVLPHTVCSAAATGTRGPYAFTKGLHGLHAHFKTKERDNAA